MGQDKTEYVPLYVTPEDKRRIEASRDNYALQMEIVKEIFATDKSFLKTEMEQVQDELLKYRALLLTIRQEYFACSLSKGRFRNTRRAIKTPSI